jgi:hypothetical protein
LFLSGFYDLTGTQTTRAYLDIADRTFAQGPNLPQIGLPAALGVVVGMADVITHFRAFAANVAHIGHDASSLNFLSL